MRSWRLDAAIVGVALGLALGTFTAGCRCKGAPGGIAGSVPETPAEFERRLRGILLAVGDQTDMGAPTREPAFREVVRDASRFRPLVECAVQNGDLSRDCRLIAVMSIQRLPLEEYLDFCERVLAALEAGRVELGIARLALLPLPEWSEVIEAHFEVERVRRVLSAYVVLDPEVGRTVAAVLAGDSWRNFNRLVDSGAVRRWE